MQRETKRALLVVGLIAVVTAGVLLAVWYRQVVHRNQIAATLASLEASLGPLDLERFAIQAPPEAVEAGTAVLAAAVQVADACEATQGDLYELLELPVGAWGEEERRRAERRLAPCQAELAALRNALERHFATSVFEPDLEAIESRDSLRPQLSLVTASRILTLDARLAAEVGDGDRLTADWNAIARLADGLGAHDALLAGVSATAVERFELRLLRGLMEAGRMEAGLARKVRQHLELRAERGDRMRNSLAFEAETLLQHAKRRGVEEPREAYWYARELHCGYELFADHVDATWVELERALARPPRRCSLAILGPNYRDAFHKFRANDAARQLAVVALTVYVEMLAGAPPQTLDAVEVARLPNRYTGETVRYQIKEDGAVLVDYPDAVVAATDAEHDDVATRPPFRYRLTPSAS